MFGTEVAGWVDDRSLKLGLAGLRGSGFDWGIGTDGGDSPIVGKD